MIERMSIACTWWVNKKEKDRESEQRRKRRNPISNQNRGVQAKNQHQLLYKSVIKYDLDDDIEFSWQFVHFLGNILSPQQ